MQMEKIQEKTTICNMEYIVEYMEAKTYEGMKRRHGEEWRTTASHSAPHLISLTLLEKMLTVRINWN